MGDLLVLILVLTCAFTGLAVRRRRRTSMASTEAAPQIRASAALATPRGATIALLVALLLILVAQYRLTREDTPQVALIAYLAGLAVVVFLDRLAEARAARLQSSLEISSPLDPFGRAADAIENDVQSPAREGAAISGTRRWLVLAGVLGALLVADQTSGTTLSSGHAGLALIWLLALACVLAAAFPIDRRQIGSWRAITARIPLHTRTEWVAATCIAIGALLLRVVAVGDFPYPFGGDEGSQAMSGVSVIEGKITNPFATGWYSVPTLFFFFQAGSIAMFGDSPGGVRVVSALMGALTVPFTFLLARRWFGPAVALVAAALLAVFHFHIHFSRLASVQVADPLFLVATLFFLDRGVREERRFDCLLAGMAIGLSQYFYLSARVIPLVAIAYSLMLFVSQGWGRRDPLESRRALPRQLRLVGWMALGAALTFLPLAGYYVGHPGEFQGRFNQVSMFASGWLDAKVAERGLSAPVVIWQQVQRAVLLPFHTPPGGWYRGDVPFLGFPMAIATAIGIAIVTAGLLRPAYFGLAISYWTVIVGLGLTDDPTQTQRLVVVGPIVAMLVAVALAALVRIGVQLLGIRASVAHALAVLAVVGLSVWNVHYYFHEPTELRLYGDSNTLVATQLAYYLRAMDGDPTVYFLAPQRMWYYGFQTLPFIARDAKGIDVEWPLDAQSSPPLIRGPTVFVFVPERMSELAFVRQWFPQGQQRDFLAPEGSLSFALYEVHPPAVPS